MSRSSQVRRRSCGDHNSPSFAVGTVPMSEVGPRWRLARAAFAWGRAYPVLAVVGRLGLSLALILAWGSQARAAESSLSSPASEQVLYAVAAFGQVMIVDLDTGEGTTIGMIKDPCFAGSTTEVEYDPKDGRALAFAPGPSFCGSQIDLGWGGELLSDRIFTTAELNGLEVVDGTWLGAGVLQAAGPSSLYQVDPITGSTTLIGATGVGVLTGLAWDPAKGVLLGVERGAPSRLVSLDPDTGAAEVIGSTGIQAESLEFGPDGRLYAGGAGLNQGEIHVLDPTSGASTLIGHTGVTSALIGSLVLGPPPSADLPLTEISRLAAPEGKVGEVFGWDVAISGSTIVVGAPGVQILGTLGRAFVFERAGSGFQLVAELCASGIDSDDHFGYSVAIDDDVIVVGAPARGGVEGPIPGVLRTGEAYVYVKPPGGWVSSCETAKLLPADDATRPPASQAHFGASVAVRGDLIAVGATGAEASGAAYLYERPEGGWVSGTQTAKLEPSDPEVKLIGFGHEVSISPDHTVAVSFKGLYLYEEPPGGWVDAFETVTLRLAGFDPSDHPGVFGVISDERAVVTTQGLFLDGYVVDVYERPATGWISTSASTKLSDPMVDSADDRFELALLRDRILLGVTAFPIAAGLSLLTPATGAWNHGISSIQAFKRGSDGWTDQPRPASRTFRREGTPNDDVGFSLAATERFVVAGRPIENGWAGAVYIFEDAIFRDGFESGELDAWSATVGPSVK